jgi:hypothetical protein
MASNAEITPALERLLKEASYGQLATVMPDGAPQRIVLKIRPERIHTIGLDSDVSLSPQRTAQ